LLTVTSLGLFVSMDPIIRLVLVMCAVGVTMFLVIRYPNFGLSRVLLTMILVLLVANAAFRSLYPLLLDPHNLIEVGR
jgi:hypothetical protein